MRRKPILLALLALAGCDKTTTEVQYLDYPDMSVSSQWLEFGEVEYGDAATRSFTLTNKGDLALGVRTVELGAGHTDSFTVGYDASSVVCPADSSDAGDTGAAEADAKIADTGGGGVAQIAVSSVSDACAADAPNICMDFGEVNYPGNDTQFFSIANAGAGALSIDQAFYAGSSAFQVVNDPEGLEIAPGDSEEVFVLYAPEADSVGDQGELFLFTNDPVNETVSVGLQGNFGAEEEETEPEEEEEEEEQSLADDQVEFVLESGCSIDLTVSFSPFNLGDTYGSLIIDSHTQQETSGSDDTGAASSDGSFEPAYWGDLTREREVVYLYGQGHFGTGKASVLPRTLDFGHWWPGEESRGYISVENTGDADLGLLAPTLSADCDEAYVVVEAYEDGAILPADTSTLIEVAFTPTDDREARCTLSVLSADVDNPDLAVSLQGNVGEDPNNEPPTVVIHSPEPGYVHGTSDPLVLDLTVTDPDQPVDSLTCKVKSTIELGIKVADCIPTSENGRMQVEIDMSDYEPGVDTLLVTATDDEETSGYASVSVIVYGTGADADDDGDGFGDASTDDWYDCDDQYLYTYPEAAEIYDGFDNDCDNIIDETTVGHDDDGDRSTELDGDCNDFDSDIYPSAPEDGDSKDNDCDGVVDEGTSLYDDDGDGYADVNNDCDDENPDVHPAADEICDGLDNDCNGVQDDGCTEIDSEPEIIGGIVAEQTAVEESESIQLSILVFDADGQDLSYAWSLDSDGGSIDDPTAPTVTWTAPELPSGSDGKVYSFYVVAQDEDGNQAWDFAEVAVYPSGELYTQFTEVVETTTEGGGLGCATAPLRRSGGVLLVVAGLLAWRRRD